MVYARSAKIEHGGVLNRSYWYDRNGDIKIGPNLEIIFTGEPNPVSVWGIDSVSAPYVDCDGKVVKNLGYAIPESMFTIEFIEQNKRGLVAVLLFDLEAYNKASRTSQRILAETIRYKRRIDIKIRLNNRRQKIQVLLG